MNNKQGKKRQLDELDRQILSYLSMDARVSNRRIASELGVTEGAIRARIKRLQEDKVIRIAVVTDLAAMEKPIVAYVGIEAEFNKVGDVARVLCEMPEIRFVATLLGRYNVLAITVIRSPEEIGRLVNDQIAPLAGVRRTETSLGIMPVKYDYRWGRILE